MTKGQLSFDPHRAYRHLKQLAVTIGPRLAGTAAEHRAARYIAKAFRSFGLQTRLQRFPVNTFHSRKCTLKVREGKKWRSIPCEPVVPTKSTPPGGVKGDIYFAESGEAEYMGPEMRNKIVLVYGRVGKKDMPLFLSYKPKALLQIDTRPRKELTHSLRSVEILKAQGNLPTASIRHADGRHIVEAGLQHAHFTMTNAITRSHSFNVIAEKKGSDRPDEIVVVCGHYDSHMNVAGAGDNASGTSIMMELARILSPAPSVRTLRFVAFAAEESGLFGSRHYAKALMRKAKTERKRKTFKKTDKTELEQHRLVFNLDVHGERLANNRTFFLGVDDIGASVRLLAKETGCVVSSTGNPYSSDGTALAAAGIPALQFARSGGIAKGHTKSDVIENMSPESLGIAGKFAQQYLTRYITQSAAFPFPREIPDEHKKMLQKYFGNKDLADPFK